jgi:hypothetical protein
MKQFLLKSLSFGIAGAFAITASAQSIPFINQTSLLTTTTYKSGNAIAVVDMNNDQKDDIVRSDNTTMDVQFQGTANGAFTGAQYTYNLSNPWGMCVADVNNDGINDALWGDNGAVRMMTWNGTTYVGSNLSSMLSSGYVFVQGVNFFDINNDAYVDAFVCADTDTNQIFINQGGTGWTYDPWAIPPGCGTPGTGASFDGSGNYASVWSDVNNDGLVDLHVTHCRQNVSSSTDMRRIDQVYINNGDGTFTQDVTNWTGLKDGAQGWSTTFGDIDNDGDMDAFVLNYDVNSRLFINDGTGVFTDQIAASGITPTTNFFGMNATFHDFDNDTYLDLMLSGDDHFLYKGNGDGTFTLVSPNPFSYSTNTITSHAVGDLNGDGFLDLYASYCQIYNTPSSTRNDRLWMNNGPAMGNTNHWIKFDLVGGGAAGFSNRNGVGAIVKIYGAWGVQTRIVHAGEGYGIHNSFRVHFGLGTATSIDSVVVQWPSGIVDVMPTLPADAAYTMTEGAFPTSNAAVYNNRPLQMIIGPNPMTEQTAITVLNFSQYGIENLSLNIYDINGKSVYSQSALNNNIIYIDRSILSNGMYFVELSNGETRLASEKLLVQ